MPYCLLAGLVLTCSTTMQAQQLLPEVEFFSKDKSGFLVRKDGSRVSFKLDQFKGKKGVIESIKGKTDDGQEFEYAAADIQEMGLPPSGFGRGMSGLQSTSSILKASKTDVNEVKRDTILFYHEYLDDQQRDVMLQLLNPDFAQKIRIYHDPAAGTTSGIGSIGGVRLTGGVDKGFYVRAGNKTFRLRKGEYEKRFDELFGSCPAVRQNYPSTAWRDFPNHVYYFEKKCP